MKESFGTLGDVVTLSGRAITPSVIKNADALVVRSITRVGQELLENSRVKFVGTATIGADHIDLDYLKEKGIAFASAPGSNANSVAEYISAALLVLSERYGFTLNGKTIGIIGAGNVGSRVAEKARALGMNPLLNDPPLARKTLEKKYLPVEKLMDADIITIHVPLIKQGPDATKHMVNKGFLARLKKQAVFINTSRGPVVDNAALKEALKQDKLSAAVLDVWENEPTIDRELLKLVSIGTPHIAGYSYDGKVNGTYMVYTALCRHLKKKPQWNPASAISGNSQFYSRGQSRFYDSLRSSVNLGQSPSRNDVIDAGGDDAVVLSEIVSWAYDILEDDRNLRRALEMPPEKTGEYFDRLRKEYRVRREFNNFKVQLKGPNKKLEAAITGLGFKLCMSAGKI